MQLSSRCGPSKSVTGTGQLLKACKKLLRVGTASRWKVFYSLGLELLILLFPLVYKGMLSCQQTQNVIDGKKRIILNPTEAQKRDFEAATFAEGEVYGMDVLIASNEDGKVCST